MVVAVSDITVNVSGTPVSGPSQTKSELAVFSVRKPAPES
jgi:hypothetical protein